MIHSDSDPGVSQHHVGHADSASGGLPHAGSHFGASHNGRVLHADADSFASAETSQDLIKKAGEPGTAA